MLCVGMLWMGEKFSWWGDFEDVVVVDKYYLVGNFVGKLYFVGYYQYGDFVVGEGFYYLQYFVDYFWVEC